MKDNKLIVPNTILIGVQKAATTSLYNWISQHPNVCGPVALKDYAFFAYDPFFEEGLELLDNIYKKEYNGEDIIMHGFVNYIFFEKSIERIKRFNPNVKLIISLRNPVDRAISAFEYQKKSNREKKSCFMDALKDEENRMKSNDYFTLSDLTYMNHGLYYKQLKTLYKHFSKNQVKVVFYEDIINKPEQVISDLFDFLNINNKFIPEFKTMNQTGEIRSKFIHSLFYSKNNFKQKIVKLIIDPLFPLDKRLKIKTFINEFNTKTKERDHAEYTKEEIYLKFFLKDDIENLENLLGRDLTSWK